MHRLSWNFIAEQVIFCGEVTAHQYRDGLSFRNFKSPPFAEYACQKYSGRVGRSTGAKRLDEDSIRLAVIAHVRHSETNYDKSLSEGMDRRLARDEEVDETIRY